MGIGERLKTARKVRNLSQDALAKEIGASRGVITNIEHGKVSNPQYVVLRAICQTLEIREEWLLTGTGQMEINEQSEFREDIVSEIKQCIEKLSEDEKQFILDLIKLYTKHLSKKDIEP